MSESDDYMAMLAAYRTEPGCLCTPFPTGNHGCPLHDAALNGRFDISDRNYDDMRRRLGGPPIRVIDETPPGQLERLRQLRAGKKDEG